MLTGFVEVTPQVAAGILIGTLLAAWLTFRLAELVLGGK